jgi:hypothetical protein
MTCFFLEVYVNFIAPTTPFLYSCKSRLSEYRLEGFFFFKKNPPLETIAMAAGVAMNVCEDLPS